MKSWIKIVLIQTVFVVGFFVVYFSIPIDKGYLRPSNYSVKIFDRNGVLITELSGNGGINESFSLSEVSPRFIELLLLSEDRRFYSHFGVDLKAMGRAVWEFVSRGRFVSGGSTITMQLVKLK
ncbi:MAG: transglycosylase domain-containing protein, partial [Brevinematia bacterium]